MLDIKKVTLIGTLIGLIIVLIGIFGPWISLYSNWTYCNETHKIYGKAYAKMSPFTMTLSSKRIACSSLAKERVVEIIPSKRYLGEDTKNFYDPLASLIGIVCILSVILSMFEQYIDRVKIALIGGIINLLSILSFFICLPQNTNALYFTVMWHWYITGLGTILIISCAVFNLIPYSKSTAE